MRRSDVASGTSASRAVSSDQPVATSSSSASSSDRESLTPGESRGPAARRRSAASRRRLGMPASSRRPRTASRLPRTVLISPLWATNPNGWASDHTGDVLVAYRWWNIANGTSIAAVEVREQLREPPAGDEALVHDGPRGRGHDREGVDPEATGRGVRPPAGAGERELERRLGEGGGAGDQRLLDRSAGRRRPRGRALPGPGARDARPGAGRPSAASAASTMARAPVSGGARAAARRREHREHARSLAGDRLRGPGRGGATASGAGGPRRRRSRRRRRRRHRDDRVRRGRPARGRGPVRSTGRRHPRRTRRRRHRARSARRTGAAPGGAGFGSVAVGRRLWSSETPIGRRMVRRPMCGGSPASAPGRPVRPGRRPRRGPRGRGRAPRPSRRPGGRGRGRRA